MINRSFFRRYGSDRGRAARTFLAANSQGPGSSGVRQATPVKVRIWGRARVYGHSAACAPERAGGARAETLRF